MLPKAKRLTKQEFNGGGGKRLPFRFGSIRVTPSDALKVSVVVSKKISKRAVDRNKIRRRVYAGVREVFRAGEPKKSFVVYPNKEILSATFRDVVRALSESLG